MLRILLPIGLLLLVVAIGFLALFQPDWVKGLFGSKKAESGLLSEEYTAEQRARILEELIKDLQQQLDQEKKSGQTTPLATPAVASAPASLTSEQKIEALEDSIVSLQAKVTTLEKAQTQKSTTSTSTVTTTTKSPPGYIPLGSGGQAGDKEYYTLDTYEVSIDPADYKGYAAASLEVSMKLAEQAGTGYARLYNSTDSSAVSSAEVSTTSDKYSLQTSGNFTLPAGKKTYRLQVKSTEGKDLILQSARIKISY